jgi:hypothetical protein
MAGRKTWLMSASSISAFKACPMRFYLGYVLGYQPTVETDSQRVGNRWHRALEIMRKPTGVCRECADKGTKNPDCDFCHGTDVVLEDRMVAIVDFLNKAYAERPASIEEEDWLAERAMILNATAVYKWVYEQSGYEIIGTEVKFKLPLVNPETGAKLPDVWAVGKIDEFARHIQTGRVLVGEHKSTSKSVDGASSYWDNLRLAVQPSIYLASARICQTSGDLSHLGIESTGEPISGCLFDVFHKPGLSPKELTQADSKAFMETGQYCGMEFTPEDRATARQTPGKKEGTFSIRETPDMFGARVFQDMTERPGYYFAQKEIARTDQDLEKFRWQLYDIYQTARNMDKHDAWFTNESQCEATFKCPYCPICYSGCQVGEGIVPTGFRVKGQKDATSTQTSSAE